MPKLTPERMRLFALDALEEALAEAELGPVCRTWALRLALAYLASLHPRSWAKAEPYRDFWRALSIERTGSRILALDDALRVIYQWAGTPRDWKRIAIIRERALALRSDRSRA